MTPETIGRYKIERRIARGGMAIIYLAHNPLMKRLVAIKLLPRQLTFDQTFRARFQREVEVIAALEHPPLSRSMILANRMISLILSCGICLGGPH